MHDCIAIAGCEVDHRRANPGKRRAIGATAANGIGHVSASTKDANSRALHGRRMTVNEALRQLKAGVAIVVAAMLAFMCQGAIAAPDRVSDCRIGIYHLGDGTVVDIAPGEGPHLRWRRIDGTSGELTEGPGGTWTSTLGWTSRPDGIQVSFSGCREGAIDFAGVRGQRIALAVMDTWFRSGGARLRGRLVMPPGNSVAPLVVLVHGSERLSAVDFYALQRLFPSQGIGVFVYDKRGTGRSAGEYTQDFDVLARDAVAAMREARRLAGKRSGRTGYQATSQGGWVAPLAASRAPVDFVVVAYGLAASPLEEDRSAIALDMTRHGYGPDIVAKAMEVADASAAVLLSGFKEGYDRVDALRAKYGHEAWFAHVHGNFTFAVLQMPHDELRAKGPALLPGLAGRYDPMPVLRRLRTPQLWVLGADDIDAPSAETAGRLRMLAAHGHPIITAVFPRAEHGIFEYETLPDGTRVSTRNAAGYLRMMADYIRDGRLHGRYGDSEVFAAQPAK
jgi:pimeloyl-ACP methyl ester carboxylesterase